MNLPSAWEVHMVYSGYNIPFTMNPGIVEPAL